MQQIHLQNVMCNTTKQHRRSQTMTQDVFVLEGRYIKQSRTRENVQCIHCSMNPMLVVSVLYDWIQVIWSHHSSLHSISWSTRLQNSPVSYAACNRCNLLFLFVNMKYRATQRGFTAEIYTRQKSCKKCHIKLCSCFSGTSFLSKSAIYQMMNKFHTGSLLMKKWEQTQCVLSEEILCNIGRPLEIAPQKVLKMAITETSQSKWPVQTPIKLLFEAIQF